MKCSHCVWRQAQNSFYTEDGPGSWCLMRGPRMLSLNEECPHNAARIRALKAQIEDKAINESSSFVECVFQGEHVRVWTVQPGYGCWSLSTEIAESIFLSHLSDMMEVKTHQGRLIARCGDVIVLHPNNEVSLWSGRRFAELQSESDRLSGEAREPKSCPLLGAKEGQEEDEHGH